MRKLRKEIIRILELVKEQKLKCMASGDYGSLREYEGYEQALKLVKLLIDCNHTELKKFYKFYA